MLFMASFFQDLSCFVDGNLFGKSENAEIDSTPHHQDQHPSEQRLPSGVHSDQEERDQGRSPQQDRDRNAFEYDETVDSQDIRDVVDIICRQLNENIDGVSHDGGPQPDDVAEHDVDQDRNDASHRGGYDQRFEVSRGEREACDRCIGQRDQKDQGPDDHPLAQIDIVLSDINGQEIGGRVADRPADQGHDDAGVFGSLICHFLNGGRVSFAQILGGFR